MIVVGNFHHVKTDLELPNLERLEVAGERDSTRHQMVGYILLLPRLLGLKSDHSLPSGEETIQQNQKEYAHAERVFILL